MNEKALQTYLLAKPEAELDYPFGPQAQVYKVLGKMFALIWFEGQSAAPRVNLKCNPEEALELRHVFEEVSAGYHMNKKHWNTVKLDGHLPESEIQRMVDSSYELDIKGLPKKQRQGLVLKLAAD